jgi:hypothetical protein
VPSGATISQRCCSKLCSKVKAEKLTRKAIDQALEGAPHALRLCIERLLPPRKERLIDLPLPEVRTAQGASAALSRVLTAVGEGQITPAEGELLTGMVDAHKRVIETEDLERRVTDIEKTVQKERGGAR